MSEILDPTGRLGLSVLNVSRKCYQALYSKLFQQILDRIETEYVTRFTTEKGVADSEKITHAARCGKNLLFFPEGTFTRIPGLRPFLHGRLQDCCRDRPYSCTSGHQRYAIHPKTGFMVSATRDYQCRYSEGGRG